MGDWRKRPIVRLAGLALGLGLTGAAAWFALGSDWGRALEPLSRGDPLLLIALGGAVLGQLILTGLLFWVVTLSFDATPPVGLFKMIQVISASSLLSYLPLEAGLVGRAAYLKLRHALPVRQSVVILLTVIGLSVVVPGAAVGLVLAPSLVGGAGAWATRHLEIQFAIAAILLVVLSLVTGTIANAALRRRTILAWTWVPLRTAELLVGASRLWLAFALIGRPVTYGTALVAAAAGFLVSLMSPTPNGLGVREWVIAALTALLSPVSGATGALAALLDRGVEAIIFTTIGGWSMAMLTREVHVQSPKQTPAEAED